MKTFIIFCPKWIDIITQLKKVPKHFKYSKVNNITIEQLKPFQNNFIYNIQSSLFGESLIGYNELKHKSDDSGHIFFLSLFGFEFMFKKTISEKWFINTNRLSMEEGIMIQHDDDSLKQFQIMIPINLEYSLLAIHFDDYNYSIQLLNDSIHDLNDIMKEHNKHFSELPNNNQLSFDLFSDSSLIKKSIKDNDCHFNH